MDVWHGSPLDETLAALLPPPRYRRVPDPGAADLLVYPHVSFGVGPDELGRALASYRPPPPCDRLLLALLVTDHEGPYPLPAHSLLYRTSLGRDRALPHERSLPYLWDCAGAPFAPSPASKRPSVGFCGYAASHPVRRRTIERLLGDRRLDPRFIMTAAFWGGRPHDPALVGAFYANIRDSQFTVCDRGVGNFSMRLYQVLSCGRIPAFVDTGMALPFPWRDVTIIGRDAADLADRIVAAHRTLDLVAMQRRCRAVYDAYLSREGFADRLHEELERAALPTVDHDARAVDPARPR